MRSLDYIRLGCVRRNYYGRKIVIYGAGNYALHTLDLLSEFHDILICDKNYQEIQKIGNHPVQNPEILKGARDRYYVCVSICIGYTDVKRLLEEYGYEDEKDYCYFHIHDVANMDSDQEYRDSYGNHIIGSLKGANVVFRGWNSTIRVGEGFQGNGVTIQVHSDVTLEIGKNVKAHQISWRFADV